MATRYYIESDGRIFLVARDDGLDLPTQDELPFKFQVVGSLACRDDVLFCVPLLDRHPADWLSKDEVPLAANVTPRVREAVHASMPRVVAEGIHVQRGRVLLLKGSRGLTKNRWTLPGGFVRFGEAPDVGLAREIAEELGVRARIGELVAVRSRLGVHTRLHWTLFFYHVDWGEEAIHPDPDEIADARYFEPQEAVRQLADPVMQEVIEHLLGTPDPGAS